MKRLGNLYEQICSLENLNLADTIARKGKKGQYGVRLHNLNREQNLIDLQKQLLNRTYKTSEYAIFTIQEKKEREIFKLPYFPDRIVHHAIMNVLEPVFVKSFTRDTYSCIKGRGIHGAASQVKQYLNDVPGTMYYLQLDIKKFYPNIDHELLKQLLRRKIKDQDLLWLLDEIIDSAPGVPIGNYLSQYFANFYLTGFDHWIKETKSVKYYLRYADDIIILAPDKQVLHSLFADIKEYLSLQLNLQIKGNYKIMPTACGINFVGYVFFHTHTLLRKSIKQSFARLMARNRNAAGIASYYGWAKHCNSINLLKKLRA